MMMNLPCLRGSYPNFLRSTYHTLSASQAPRRGHAPWKIPLPATALVFLFDCSDLRSTVMILIYSVDATPLQPSVGLCADVVHFTLPSDLRVSFPEPCPVSDAFHQPLDRVLELLLLFYLLCCHWCL